VAEALREVGADRGTLPRGAHQRHRAYQTTNFNCDGQIVKEGFMPGLLRPVTALLLSAAILLMGNGLLGILGPIRADLEQFTRLEIGIMGSFYFAGLMTGCIVWPRIIGSVGHIRAFSALTAIAVITPLIQAVWPTPPVWWAMRALNGLVFAGLFMVIESWLNGVSNVQTRGRVLASYTIINLTVVTLGMQFISLSATKGFELFILVAILYSLAIVPVALAPTAAPAPPRAPRLRLGWLYSVSPAAVLGCFFTGLANSGFWTLSPLYAQGAGFDVTDIAWFLTIAVLGGAASQWPIGILSDRLGRRALAIQVASLASVAGIGLYLASSSTKLPILFLAAIYGASAFPVYTLCVAHANDLVHKKRAVEVSSGLLLTFSIGAVFGPLVASLMMRAAGHGALFLHSALAHIMIASTMVLRAAQRPAPPAKRSERFVSVPKTTPAVFDLDPRGEPEAAVGPPTVAQAFRPKVVAPAK
jgi:MFS family permease